MNTMVTIIVVVQVLSASIIIGLVLLQHGKGADMGAAFGSGASGSLFGATGSSNFLSKSTGFAAAVFFGATLALAFFGNQRTAATGVVMDSLPASVVPAVPATPPASSTIPVAPAATGGINPAAPVTSNSSGQANQIPK